jgi:hypothetical protein
MFISNLIHTIETYDPYGLYRLNSIRMLYILIILFAFNIVFALKTPYFYFFYLPLTVMSVELAATTVQERTKILIYTTFYSVLWIFIINILRPYQFIYILAVFTSSMSLYLMAFKHQQLNLGAVSAILSLVAYSLNYPKINSDLNQLINDMITTTLAVLVILGAIVLFPLSYYYRLWLRALILLIQESLESLISNQTQNPEEKKSINTHAIQLTQFTKLLPHKLPLYTIIKINLLTHKLHSMCSVKHKSTYEDKNLISDLSQLLNSIQQEQPCSLPKSNHIVCISLIKSWNRLCLIY